MGHLFPGVQNNRAFFEAGNGSGMFSAMTRFVSFDWVQVSPTMRPIKELHFVLICEPSLKVLRLVDRRLILLEIYYPIRIHFLH
jgi:hypothetical protein